MGDHFEHQRFERARVQPDQEQRLRRHDDHYGRPRRARPWIAVAIGLAVLAVFVYLVATDDGEENDPSTGAPAGSVALG